MVALAKARMGALSFGVFPCMSLAPPDSLRRVLMAFFSTVSWGGMCWGPQVPVHSLGDLPGMSSFLFGYLRITVWKYTFGDLEKETLSS